MDELSNRALTSPDGIAAICSDTNEVITNLQLHEKSARLGAMLAKSGLQPGDCIALLTERSVRGAEIRGAALRMGLECLTISAGEVSQLPELLVRCKAKILFSASKYRRLIEELSSTLSKQLEVIYVDGIEAREIVDGYEWTIAFGDVAACLSVIAISKGALNEVN